MMVGSRLIVDSIGRIYQKHIPAYVSGNLIDLGCGAVPLFEAYSGYADKVVCVDWPGTRHKAIHLDYECDLTQPLPFEDSEFDTIVLSDVLEHIPTPDLLWKEMARILRKDGHILLNVPFYYCLHESPHDFYRYTEHALRRFATEAELNVVLLTNLGGTPEILGDILSKHTQFVPLIGPLIARIIVAIVTLLLKTRPGRLISEKTGSVFPLGYFMVVEKK